MYKYCYSNEGAIYAKGLWEIVFGVISGNYLLFTYKKCRNDCEILKIILVPDFCPLKPEIARFSIGFQSS